MEALMPIVTGYVQDITQQPLVGAQLRFRPTGPAVVGDVLFTSTYATVDPNNGGMFSVNLLSTDSLNMWYTIEAQSLDSGGNFTFWEDLGLKLFVPTGGGSIGDLLGDQTALPVLTVLQMPKQITLPFSFSIPVSIQRNPGGSYTVPTDPSTMYTPSAGPTYYVSKTGSNTNDGLTMATAFATIAFAATKNSSNWGTIIVGAGLYNRTDGVITIGNGCALKAAAGAKVVIACGDVLPTWTHTTGNAYSAPVSTCNGVLDAVTWPGDPIKLTLVADAATVAATPGSWYFASGTVYVNLTNGRVPDSNVLVSRSVNSLSFNASTAGIANVSCYVEGIEFWGGTTANLTAPSTGAAFYAKNSKWKYAGTTNGLSIIGLAKTVLVGCEASWNYLDGFNYHQDGSSRNGDVLEVDCVGIGNGAIAGSNNGSTSHDSYQIVRVGDLCGQNSGANFADVNSAKAFNVGCTGWLAGQGAVIYEQDFFGDNVWSDGCYSRSVTAFQVATTGVVRIRDCAYTGGLVGNVVTY